MNPVVQDRPLAVIDYWSVNRNDLLAADRVTPFIAGEIYYLKFNPDLRWSVLVPEDSPLARVFAC